MLYNQKIKYCRDILTVLTIKYFRLFWGHLPHISKTAPSHQKNTEIRILRPKIDQNHLVSSITSSCGSSPTPCESQTLPKPFSDLLKSCRQALDIPIVFLNLFVYALRTVCFFQILKLLSQHCISRFRYIHIDGNFL